MRAPLIHHERPLFGLDIGSRTVKALQLRNAGKNVHVVGYGSVEFPSEAVVEGIIVDPKLIADVVRPLLKTLKLDRADAGRVAVSIPTAKVFTRMLELPLMNHADMAQAVQFEAEQYIPVPLSDLYIDFEIIEKSDKHVNVLMVAAPRAIVDSYMQLFEELQLQVVFVESSMAAVTRAIVSGQPLAMATLVADFGSDSIDLTVFDRVIRLTDTISVGGDHLTKTLMEKLELDAEHANTIKFKFGLGPSGLQPKVMDALGPQLATIVSAMKRVAKFYETRSADHHPLETIVISGGSASMPGLIEYLQAQLGIKVQVANPWAGLVTDKTPGAADHDAPMYATAIGLARLEGRV